MFEKKQVLIVCRTAAGQMYLGVLLNRIWYSPVLAKTAAEAVALARTASFSLILFDGDMLSDELLPSITLLRSDPTVKSVPLVLFLTNESAETTQALLAQGCSAILTKPLDLAIVYGVLGRLSGQPRSAPRVPAKMQVEILDDVPEKKLMSVNISEGGLYLRTASPLPEGTVVRIRFSLPHDSDPLELSGEVVRSQTLDTQMQAEPGMGLRFLGISEDQIGRIRNYAQWSMMGDLEWDAGI
ncbi:MAG TPA: TIGR02266 family protein [Nitrospirota bacterium]|nr:TIGR02266 family protein [Nitrospirota bacterium]